MAWVSGVSGSSNQRTFIEQGLDNVGLWSIAFSLGFWPMKRFFSHPSLEFNKRFWGDRAHQRHESRSLRYFPHAHLRPELLQGVAGRGHCAGGASAGDLKAGRRKLKSGDVVCLPKARCADPLACCWLPRISRAGASEAGRYARLPRRRRTSVTGRSCHAIHRTEAGLRIQPGVDFFYTWQAGIQLPSSNTLKNKYVLLLA